MNLYLKILCLKFKFRQFGAKIKISSDYLKMCTLVNLKVLNTNLTLVDFKPALHYPFN